MQDGCPNETDLSGYLNGRLDNAQFESVDQHVDTCGDCQTKVHELRERPDELVELIRRPEVTLPFSEETELVTAISRCRETVSYQLGERAPRVREHDEGDEPLTDFGNYLIVGMIGAGGMGAVYKAYHTLMERYVAIKILPPHRTRDSRAVERFKKEVIAGGKLGHHPNIVADYDATRHGGKDLLVMEYVDGQDLAAFVRQNGPLSVEQALDCILQAASGLRHAHKSGVIHRDIKPANLILDEGGTVKVLDLGLARIDQETAKHEQVVAGDPHNTSLTATGQVMGTVHYMSPEQAASPADVDARTDIYSLGCTLYTLLMGGPPFRGKSANEVVDRHASAAPPSLCASRHDVPVELDRVFQRMIAKSVNDRPQSMDEAIVELDACRGVKVLDRDLTHFLGGLAQVAPVVEAPDFPAVGESASHRRIQETAVPAGIPRYSQRKTIGFTLLAIFALVSVVGLSIVLTRRASDAPDGTTFPGGVPQPFDVRLLHTTGQLTGLVSCVTFSPDGRWLASAEGPFIRLWDPRTGLGDRPLGRHDSDIRSLAFSTDGNLLASCGDDQVVRIWDAADRRTVAVLPGHTMPALTVVFSPDGKSLASSGQDASIALWDVEQQNARQRLSDHSEAVSALAFLPPGNDRLLSAGRDARITMWNVETGAAIRSFDEHAHSVNCLAVSSDGGFFVSGAGETRTGVVKTWSRDAGSCLLTFSEHGGPVRSVTIAADDRTVASGDDSGMVIVWDGRTGRSRVFLKFDNEIRSLEFSPDGSLLAAVALGEPIKLWRSGTDERVRDLNGNALMYRSLSFSPDGKTLAGAATDGASGFVRLYDVASGTEQVTLPQVHRHTVEFSSLVNCVLYCPNGEDVATASDDGTVKIWNLQSRSVRTTLIGHESEVTSIACSPDGKMIASASYDQTVRIWNIDDGQPVSILKGHTDAVNCVRYSPDGNTIASGSHDETIRIWDVETGESKAVLRGHINKVTCLAFSPDGLLLASGGRNRQIRVWDVAEGKLTRKINAHSSEITCLEFTPNGHHLLSGSYDNTIRVWDVGTGLRIRVFSDHENDVLSLAVSRDGARFASASREGIINVWELTSE